MNFDPVTQIKVSLSFGGEVIPVGRLALRDKTIYFEYDASFLDFELDISPFNCPLRPGLQTFDPHLFAGLPGVCNDSLPDGWGRLLLDRKMRLAGVLPQEISSLDRLAHVGHAGMGALVYEPDHSGVHAHPNLNLDKLAAHAQQILAGEASAVLQELLALNGSSAGARPKAMICVSKDRKDIVYGAHALKEGYEPWLVKFPNVSDGLDAGAIEYVYARMATEAGIEMEEVHLFPGAQGPGYFATKRFDCIGGKRLHLHSACGLLHSDFRTPTLDYEELITLTMMLTKDMCEAEKMFRLAVFNVLAHNRDDHAKNFSFLMDPTGQWKLAPAYDLTFSSGPQGEQSTMVLGEGKNPGIADLVALGKEAKIRHATIAATIDQTRAALDKWQELAAPSVAPANLDLIHAKTQR